MAKHSSRTEAHLMVTLNPKAALEAAAAAAAASAGGGSGSPTLLLQPELVLLRQRLHCQLAQHLVSSYWAFLGAEMQEARAAGDTPAVARLEAAPTEPPISTFVLPYPEGATEVPERALPPRPEPGSARASPLGAAVGPAGARSSPLLLPPTTPMTTMAPPSTSDPRGRPPLHPNTVDRSRRQQRRLSFSAAAAATGGGGAGAPFPVRITRPGSGDTPLDKLHWQVLVQKDAEHPQSTARRGLGSSSSGSPTDEPAAPRVAGLPAVEQVGGEEEEEQWNGAILSEEDAALLASMPEELRRRSSEGIISMGALRVRTQLHSAEHRCMAPVHTAQQQQPLFASVTGCSASAVRTHSAKWNHCSGIACACSVRVPQDPASMLPWLSRVLVATRLLCGPHAHDSN